MMPDTFEHAEMSPQTPNRRSHERQTIRSLAYIELDEGNGGIVLNISEDGMAVQAVMGLVEDHLPNMRFQLSNSKTWVETGGQIVWKSESRKTAGLQFVGLPEEARNQIREWISIGCAPGESREAKGAGNGKGKLHATAPTVEEPANLNPEPAPAEVVAEEHVIDLYPPTDVPAETPGDKAPEETSLPTTVISDFTEVVEIHQELALSESAATISDSASAAETSSVSAPQAGEVADASMNPAPEAISHPDDVVELHPTESSETVSLSSAAISEPAVVEESSQDLILAESAAPLPASEISDAAAALENPERETIAPPHVEENQTVLEEPVAFNLPDVQISDAHKVVKKHVQDLVSPPPTTEILRGTESMEAITLPAPRAVRPADNLEIMPVAQTAPDALIHSKPRTSRWGFVAMVSFFAMVSLAAGWVVGRGVLKEMFVKMGRTSSLAPLPDSHLVATTASPERKVLQIEVVDLNSRRWLVPFSPSSAQSEAPRQHATAAAPAQPAKNKLPFRIWTLSPPVHSQNTALANNPEKEVPPSVTGLPANTAGDLPALGSIDSHTVGPPPMPDPAAQTASQVKGMEPGKLIHSVNPVYPPAARQYGVQGAVKIHALIAADGTVKSLKPISGPTMLIPSAMNAVRQWRYEPTLLHGKPVESDREITIVFRTQ